MSYLTSRRPRHDHPRYENHRPACHRSAWGGVAIGIAAQAVIIPSPHTDHRSGEGNVILEFSEKCKGEPAGACPWQDEPFEDDEEADHLELITSCGKVQGRVTAVVKEIKDERTTYHPLLVPDEGHRTLPDPVNDAQEGGALVIETETEDVGILPQQTVGLHPEVRGPHVRDTTHGWNEIHPALGIGRLA